MERKGFIAAYTDDNELDFTIKYWNENETEIVKRAIEIGINSWYAAAYRDEEIEGNEFFTKEEIKAFYGSGYADPTCEILDKLGIEYELADIEIDEYGNAIEDKYIAKI